MSATTRSGSPRCSASHSVSTSTAARVLAPPTARTALHVLTLCHPNFGLSGLRLGVTGNQTSRCEPARRGRAMGEGEAPEAEIRQIVNEKRDMVGLGGGEKKRPVEISGGMRKGAGLARGLVLDPEIVM